ncbi:MAG: CPBP family intramembrane metalloprotease [Oscillospiraceae bacterium]|nr:CPBP family intramembrane metalloprotease [Oscillospiraceae bacterium]
MTAKKGIILGLSAFVTTMAIMLLVAAPIQYSWGLYGLAVTEFMFLLITLGFAFGFKLNLKDVFPLKKPTMRHFFGSLLIYGGSYLLTLAVSYVQMYLFPQAAEVGQGLSEFFTTESLFAALIIVAVMPGIFEEILHRGLILSTFGGIKKTWLKVLVMAVIFGIFHWHIFRFMPTAILGAGLTYMAIKTGSLWMPMLFHFINNAIGILGAFSGESADGIVDAGAVYIDFGTAAGFALTFSGIAVGLLYLGWRVFNKRKAADIPPQKRWAMRLLPWTLAFVGVVILGSAIMEQPGFMRQSIYETNMTAGAGDDISGKDSFEIPKTGTYRYDFKWNDAYGWLKIADSQGKIYYDQGSETGLWNNGYMEFEAGKYTFEYVYRPFDDSTFKCVIS